MQEDKAMSLSKSETETHISWTLDEKEATLYTNNPVWMRKMDKLCNSHSDVTMSRQDGISKTYKFPFKWVKVVPPRFYTDEKRKELAERARANFHK